MSSVACFSDRLCEAAQTKKSILLGGLDFQPRCIPPHLIKEVVAHYGRTTEAMGRLALRFNCAIIDAAHDLLVGVKPNLAFLERYGQWGIWAFEETVTYAQAKGLLVIADGKRNDGGDTADAYADAYLGKVPFFGMGADPADLSQILSPVRSDCLTVTPYIGEDCISRFVARVKEHGTGIFVVTKTSFKPNSYVEQLQTSDSDRPVWQKVAFMVNEWGRGTEGACGLRNVGVVMGATYPNDAVIMRGLLPNAWLLKPGYGGQGASAQDSVVGIRDDGFGVVVNNSRNFTYAWQNKKGKHQCEPEKFASAARLEAIDNRDELASAAREAGKWPF
ncbi:MAG: orotidine-5'-phosphate decarboxylase [Candidatus Staskawiczbacteria bacterium]|nr:orotidine-5'-phosphate decarboxylase [Candidatus Staskawiczbacteria bacterium]